MLDKSSQKSLCLSRLSNLKKKEWERKKDENLEEWFWEYFFQVGKWFSGKTLSVVAMVPRNVFFKVRRDFSERLVLGIILIPGRPIRWFLWYFKIQSITSCTWRWKVTSREVLSYADPSSQPSGTLNFKASHIFLKFGSDFLGKLVLGRLVQWHFKASQLLLFKAGSDFLKNLSQEDLFSRTTKNRVYFFKGELISQEYLPWEDLCGTSKVHICFLQAGKGFSVMTCPICPEQERLIVSMMK